MIYTYSERTVKKYTVGKAFSTAKLLLKEKHNIQVVCINALKHRSDDEAITLEELNNLCASLVDDTLYHEGYWTGTKRT